jgi:hypothetical protein
MWEAKPPGTLWATPGLLREFFTFTFTTEISNLKIYDYILLFVKTVILRGWQKERKKRREQGTKYKKNVGERSVESRNKARKVIRKKLHIL